VHVAVVTTKRGFPEQAGVYVREPKDASEYIVGHYGTSAEPIQYFALSFRDYLNVRNAKDYAEEVLKSLNEASTSGEVPRLVMSLGASQMHRVRLAPDRHLVLCCNNITRWALNRAGPGYPPLPLEDLQFLAFKQDSGKPWPYHCVSNSGSAVVIASDLSIPAQDYRITTGGFRVDVHVELLPDGDSGFRFTLPQ
jgi:hypothetical protein